MYFAICHKWIKMLLMIFLIIDKAIKIRKMNRKYCTHRSSNNFGVKKIHCWSDKSQITHLKSEHSADDGAKIASIAWMDEHDMVGMIVQFAGILFEYT